MAFLFWTAFCFTLHLQKIISQLHLQNGETEKKIPEKQKSWTYGLSKGHKLCLKERNLGCFIKVTWV